MLNLKIAIVANMTKNITTNSAIVNILGYINACISATTDINYHPNQICVINRQYILPIDLQPKFESVKIEKFKKESIDTITNTIKNAKFETVLWYVRWLKHANIDPFNLLVLRCDSLEIPLELHFPETPEPTITETQYKNLNLIVRQIIDPLIDDYGFYVDESKKFSDLNYQYNALHIYEHMLTYAWNKLPRNNLITYNATTSNVASCFTYNVFKTSQNVKEYVIEYIKFKQNIKTVDYWKKELNDGLLLETKRTFSETIKDPNLTNFFRTDNEIYKNKIYDYNIFKYYASQPYLILLITPEPIEINLNEFEQVANPELNNQQPPPAKTFDYIPLTVLRNKSDPEFLRIMKGTPGGSNPYNKYIIGIDNYGFCASFKKLGFMCNSLLVNILFDKKIKNVEEFLKKLSLCKSNVIVSKINIAKYTNMV